MPLYPRRIFEPEILTPLLNRRLIGSTAYNIDSWFPIVTTNKRIFNIDVSIGQPQVLGQFRPDAGATPLNTPYLPFATREVELPDLAEQEKLTGKDFTRLDSPDEGVQADIVSYILGSAERLYGQNTQLTIKMAFDVLQDALAIPLLDGSTRAIDFDLDNTAGFMSASHRPTVVESWDDPDADIRGVVTAWSRDLIVEDSGEPATTAIMSTTVFNYMQANKSIQYQFSSSIAPRQPNTPEEMATILNLRNVVLYDEFWVDRVTKAKTRFLPETLFILTANPAAIVGKRDRLMRMMDGPVARYRDGEIRVEQSSGAVTGQGIAEVYSTPEPLAQFTRFTTARMPIIIPQGIVTGTVITS